MDNSTTIEYLARIEKALLGVKEVLTLDEACVYTGISKSYMYRLTSQNEIPFSKSRKMIYFCRKTLDEWLIERPHKTKDQIEKRALSYITKNKKA